MVQARGSLPLFCRAGHSPSALYLGVAEPWPTCSQGGSREAAPPTRGGGADMEGGKRQMCFPRGLNLGASSSRWQRPGLSQQQVTRGWCAWTGGPASGSSERMEGHWGHCLASSVLKGVHVKGQGPQPPPAASPRLRVPDGPAYGGLLAGATAEVLRRGQGRDNPLPHLPQWTWLRSRPNATLKRED